jgi:hypothetical protein
MCPADRQEGMIDMTDEKKGGKGPPEKDYKLNVQGVVIDWPTSSISVRDAITKAGFDANKPWLIFLKVQGHPKEEVALDRIIDLTLPGLEKLRLTPKDVTNGEAPVEFAGFALLDADEDFLDGLGLKWETVVENQRRWLIVHNYPVPPGYTAATTTIALEVPTNYPSAQIDMFYCYPPLALALGRAIASTQVRAVIKGNEFHGWSRHRGGAWTWDPAKDNVSTQFALVDECIAREIGE